MLDIKYVKENLEAVKKAIEKRGVNVDLEKAIKLDAERKELQNRIETLQAEQNKLAKEGLPAGRHGQKTDKAIEIKQMLKDLKPQLQEAEENYKVAAVVIPNPPLSDVPAGNTENNEVIKKVGKISIEKGKNHLELGKDLNIIDIDRAVKVSGSRFYYLKNEAVELEFTLIKYALDIIKKEGFQPIIPPILIKEDIAWGSGHFEAVNDDAYHTTQDNMVAVGTSEQSILPMYTNEILEKLPQRFVGFSTCLRREAGSYGKDVKGILRVHQFDKLEMFSFCKSADSEKEHQLIVDIQEKIMQGLELPYQVVLLAAGDLGLPSAKTIDIETYLPGEGKYRETHSSSNCTDFQARRLNIRHKDNGKNEFVHTINGTAVAIGRILIAILENHQQKDGSIIIPKALQKYTGFDTISLRNTK